MSKHTGTAVKNVEANCSPFPVINKYVSKPWRMTQLSNDMVAALAYVSVATEVLHDSLMLRRVNTIRCYLTDFVFGNRPRTFIAKNLEVPRLETYIVVSDHWFSCRAQRNTDSQLPPYGPHWIHGAISSLVTAYCKVLFRLDDQLGRKSGTSALYER